MVSRDRDSKSFQDKLKVFFKKEGVPARRDLVVKADLERELGVDTPLPRRLRAARDLTDRVVQLRVQDGGVERIWRATRDLLEAPGGAGAEARHTALALFGAVTEGQADRLSIMRTVIFKFLKDTHAHRPTEDEVPRFRLLHALTNTGKNITCFEEEIGAFLIEWLSEIQNLTLLIDFLQLVTNVVKFNASYLDEEIVHGIINSACGVLEGPAVAPAAAEGGPTAVEVGNASLVLLEAVVSYSLLPLAALPTFLATLCRTINLEAYTQHSWKLMRCVVGADIGPTALHSLLELAGGGAGGQEAGLARGAVSYIHMALWGARRVPTLRANHRAVLQALQKAVELGHPVVTYEVVAALAALVGRAHADLLEPTWHMLLTVIRRVLEQDKDPSTPRNELIHSRVHSLLTAIEQLLLANQYTGCRRALLELLDCVGHERPEASAMWLVTARAAALNPWGGEWTAGALQLADKYLRHEPRRTVRLHTLNAILNFIMRNNLVYGEELVECVGVPVATLCAQDAEPTVRAAAATALTELAKVINSDVTADLLELLEKILNRPFEMYVTDVPIPADADVNDLKLAAGGLLSIFHDKLLRSPAAPPARALLILLDHLDHHYRRPALFHHHPETRLKIFEMVFGLRANFLNCVGFCYDETGKPVYGERSARLRPLCSPFLYVEPIATRGQVSAPPPRDEASAPAGTCVLGAGRAARAIIAALTRETDWTVLGTVLRTLPSLLQLRALAVGRRAQDLDMLASTLCAMVSDRSLSFPDCVRLPAGGKLTLSEFQNSVLPVLAALSSYHMFLEPHTQQRIVRCLLRFGMVLRTPQPYINALTIFTLETRETMVKMLPEVLLDLSKISDTKLIACPMLEFLSTLTRLPRVFASFVEDQYMSVFAILLPYTNPSRYNKYVVSLAHHVIAAWFLKCRLSYRRNFVRFIIHGLHNFIILPFAEQERSARHLPGGAGSLNPAPANEDSSNRQRSSSLGSRAVGRIPMNGRGRAGVNASAGEAAFHVELTETCVDLLSRYAFTPCSVKPHRSDLSEFMFNGGQSSTWIVGHKLITITTSGCLQNNIKQGLCERCAVLCRQHSELVASPLPPLSDPPALLVQQNEAALEHGDMKRQNSGDSRSEPSGDAAPSQRDRDKDRDRDLDSEDGSWSRVGDLVECGACPCWCSQWAEIHVRSPTGDTGFVTRLLNPTAVHAGPESLEDVESLLTAPYQPPPAPSDPPSDAAPAPPAPAPAGAVISEHNMSEDTWRESYETDLHKSSSDSVVVGERAPPHAATHCIGPPAPARMSTQPINIPGSPQRQSSSSTTDDDDLLLIAPSGKMRHPVRRSNSSPEMSSCLLSSREEFRPDPELMIVLPPAQPPSPAPGPSSGNSSAQNKKCIKKNDMRVSCEAIPEEMSGTSPLAPPPQPAPAPPPHLMTYNSDPGSRSETDDGALAGEKSHHQLQKTASDTTVGTADRPPAGPRGLAASRDDLPPLARNKRANTISVMSPTRRYKYVPHSDVTAGTSRDDLPPLARNKRANTISVMSPTRRHKYVPHSDVTAGTSRDDLPPLARNKRANTISVMSPTRRYKYVPHSDVTAGTSRDDLPPLARNKRANTISVMSPTRRYKYVPHSDVTAAASRDDLPPLARNKRANTISVMSPTRRYKYVPHSDVTAGTSRDDLPPLASNKRANTISVMSPTRRYKYVPHSDVTAAASRDDLPPLARNKRANTISVMSPTRRYKYVPHSDVTAAASRDDLPPLARNKRANTISVMSPTRRYKENGAPSSGGGGGGGSSSSGSANQLRDGPGGVGVTPAFVLLQLYHNMSTYPTTPPVPAGAPSMGGGGGSSSSGSANQLLDGPGGVGVTQRHATSRVYHNMSTYPTTPPVPGAAPTLQHPLTERPLKVCGATHERTIKNLDLVPPLETYKVGVLYVGPGQQDDEVAILSNEYGSVRYQDFLCALGTVVSLEEGDEASRFDLFLNLELGGKDGLYTYVWSDDVTQVQFHVGTAMPLSPADPQCNEKRKYIGNDYVSIVYNDSGKEFNITTIKGQLNFCIVVIEPTEHGLNRVMVKTKDERIRTKFLSHVETHVVSDCNVALLARQTALHCCLASQISQSLKMGGAPYASNALERLRLIKRLRRRAEAERMAAAARAPAPYAAANDVYQRVAIDDFNDFT